MGHPVNKLTYAERLQVAHSAMMPRAKKRYSVEDFQNGYTEIQVGYYDQDEVWSEETIMRSVLIDFVLDFYSTVVDCQVGGEHEQYEDTRSADYYLDENMSEVLTDYLNHRK